MSFSSFRLHADVLRGVKELGFQRPTPIQEQAIPPAVAGRDVLACAMTGSGKTAAFLLPVLHRLVDQPRGRTRALVLTPTRELAAQIHQHLEALAVHTPVGGATVFGGVGMGPQEHAFRSGVDVIVATPGRLLDHLRHPYARFDALQILILDEADRMLDMGFLPDIRRILRHVPTKRQTLFFSATMPREIVALAGEMLHDPCTIDLERKSAPAVGITQAVYPVARELKSALLLALLQRDVIADAIVFTRTKHRANRLADYLEKRGVATARIHGNRSQNQRTLALEGFKAGRYRVLVATDIVARGIDVESLGHVINFDVPVEPDAYIHRVGRTARASATGDAFTFVSPDEETELRAIERAIGARLPRVTLPDFDYAQRVTEQLEIPLRDRLAAHRRQRGATAGAGGRPRTGQPAPATARATTASIARAGKPAAASAPSATGHRASLGGQGHHDRPTAGPGSQDGRHARGVGRHRRGGR
jgi:ATP-dependent RNA helicase RhlE